MEETAKNWKGNLKKQRVIDKRQFDMNICKKFSKSFKWNGYWFVLKQSQCSEFD